MTFLKWTNKRGVSLMEVLTATAIIAILGSMSFVAARRYTRKAFTTEAKASLSMIFASQSQYRAACNTYHPDLQTIGALPKGELRYNVGSPMKSGWDWGSCLTDNAANCSDCDRYFDEICVNSVGTKCDKSMFDDFSSGCNCYIRPDYKVPGTTGTPPNMDSYYSANYSTKLCNISGTLEDEFCYLAVTAINRNDTSTNPPTTAVDSDWDIWVVNHLNIIKQVYYPGD